MKLCQRLLTILLSVTLLFGLSVAPGYAGPPPLTAALISTNGGALQWRTKLDAAVASGQAYNPRLTPPATNSAGTYTLRDGSTVTISVSTTAPSSTTNYPAASSRVIADYTNLFRIENGYPEVTFSTNAWAPATRTVSGGSWNSGTGVIDNPVRYSVDTNAPTMTFNLVKGGVAGTKQRFLVNGQYIDLAGTAPADTSANPQYYTLTFSDSRIRTVTVESQTRYIFQRLMIAQGTNLYSVSKPTTTKPRVIFVADSYGMGPYVGTGIASDATQDMQGDGIYQQAADWLGVEGIVSAWGGSSFTNGTFTYAQRWQDVVGINAQAPIDALHIHGSVNDAFSSSTVPQIQAAATAYILNAVQTFPNIPITVSGCLQLQPGSSSNTKAIQVEAAYAAAVASVIATTGTTKLVFIPVQSPAYVPTWPTSAQAPSSLVAYDAVHLTGGIGGGHASLGKHMAADIARAWSLMK